MNCDVWTSYRDANEALQEMGYKGEPLSEDRNIEQLGLVVGIRKWTWDGLGDCGGPSWPLELGLDFGQHLPVFEKYDIFIYERN